MVIIAGVEKGSIAQRNGFCVGDKLFRINGNEINDVLDYRFYIADKCLTVECERAGKRIEFLIRKPEYSDIGLEFESALMDKKHSCTNKCIFCFIDQLPDGMRETLYFKDDDSRLSFLHGNYITLTNLKDSDIDRIIKMRISPLNISVHTTDSELRCRMMGNRFAGEKLKYLKRLSDAGIKLCCQIVLCKGVNDGASLDKTMHDLATYYPALTSVSIVPAGLTKYREGLYPLEPYNSEECREIIKQVNSFGNACFAAYGTRIFFAADELYIKGGLPLPDSGYYEEYPQIENGVGMITSLVDEFCDELEYRLPFEKSYDREVSIATGEAAYDTIKMLASRLADAVTGLKINVYKVKNNYFGENITVAGLLTGEDIKDQLEGQALGEELLISENTLRDGGDLFLCGMTPKALSEGLGVRVRAVRNDGACLLAALLGEEDPF